MCSRLLHPIDGFDVVVELHIESNSTLFESCFDNLLLFGWEEDIAPSALEIGVAPEVAHEYGHELVILCRVHAFLKIGEAFGKYHGLTVGIVGAVGLLGASRGVEQMQVQS